MSTIFGDHDELTIRQLQDVAVNAERTALMADGHPGYVMPIGGVAAYRERVSVVGVGFDIACGNAAIRTDLDASILGEGKKRARIVSNIADEIAGMLHFGLGRKNRADDAPTDHDLFEDAGWRAVPVAYRDELRAKARAQLGTVGSGNHYVDLFADETGTLWVGVHFGSRGFGHTVASNFLALGQGLAWGQRAPEVEVLLDLDSPLGDAYWTLMNLAGQYAYAGREWVARKVVALLGAKEMELVHNHHNFAWKETHGGEELVVVRKGATPAFPGQRGFVGGSMGDNAVIVQGALEAPSHADVDLREAALFSTVHGAGRVMSRTAAAGKVHRKSGTVLRVGAITDEMMDDWLAERGVELRGGGPDEAPQAYRRLPQVLAAQQGTIEVLHTLRPLIVVMAERNEWDPYRD